MQRWKLEGLQGYESERAIVKALINSGQIDVPSSDDGRYSNIASINVKALLFTNKAAAEEAINARILQNSQASDAEKQRINREIVLLNALNANVLD
ncbi:Putative 2,3-cyclic-nucleotide 2-phosphodiesterase [Vibrio anguillarum]|nr:2',3'-cyclic-nucleotide 2'-phosphodiesterase [Vibrio anguillarum 775]AGU58908.1 hypothetical protein N175_09170 [Vibrio anguillarum M3]ARV26326.1 putative 2',3'-cyclic-nucleotide 2'-phosphodiesterase [Vibrio anguillarum]ASF91679.1 hypothetical protein CEA93_06395 [Vibrio anguillarum]AVT68282.1 hypothetical protein B5S57_14190 [Vibrio anguillarum]